ncbi:metalloregulator ArsR/SmtB family transcription factor [Thiomicrorhabdus sp. Milos-T2]|uniref:ArsR/SmtB family transcription factor n=1 Tax=Thiomicrorhabdus sp. Milos-T2 TaxID=90814 RepID=UPI000494210C|nr:metalloregulator ArsR/SmtB family transcription factor [Thiomicrorhabdus sp. Milos-T2]
MTLDNMKLDNITQLFKALSDPIRLRILNLLITKDSFCVCEIVDILGIGQSTISRHLAYLKNSGLVESWREGVWMHYSLIKENMTIIEMENLKLQLEQCDSIIEDNKRLKKGNLACSNE